MRILLGAIVAATLAWSGWWAWGAMTLRDSIENWIAERRDAGWVAEYDDLRVAGFPNRLDTTFQGLLLADPERGLAWRMPLFQILSLRYDRDHLILAWPHEQVISTPRIANRLRSASMRASLRVDGADDRALRQAVLVAEDLRLDRGGDAASAERLRIAMAPHDADRPRDYRLTLVADGLRPTGDWAAQVDPQGILPATMAVTVDLGLGLDRLVNADAWENGRRPQVQRIAFDDVEVRWGDLRLSLSGRLKIDDKGWPRGDLTLRAREWRQILRVMRAAERLPESWLDAAEEALRLVARLQGDADMLKLPLTLKNREIRLGPIRLGRAPRLAL